MIGSAALASAGGERVAVALGLEPAYPGAHVLGPAFTVQGAPADNLALHHALGEASAGDVLVVAVGGERETAHVGGIVASAAKERGIAGIVVDGAVRDRPELAEIGLPIFHLGTSPRGPAKNGPGALRVPVELAGVAVAPGDLVCADADGVTVVPAEDAEAVLEAARALEAKELGIVEALRRGETTVAIYGLKPL